VPVCDVCVSDLLYCDRHGACFCPVCDRWQEQACTDSECTYCPVVQNDPASATTRIGTTRPTTDRTLMSRMVCARLGYGLSAGWADTEAPARSQHGVARLRDAMAPEPAGWSGSGNGGPALNALELPVSHCRA
jgi:hypothetical protein